MLAIAPLVGGRPGRRDRRHRHHLAAATTAAARRGPGVIGSRSSPPVAGRDRLLPGRGRGLRRRLRARRADSVPGPDLHVDRALTLLFAPDYLRPRGLPMAEFGATLAVRDQRRDAARGGARDLLILFLGLELMVLPGYMLAGYAKRDGLSTEGAIKYFLLGLVLSAIFLFGLAFVFGYRARRASRGRQGARATIGAAARALRPAGRWASRS